MTSEAIWLWFLQGFKFILTSSAFLIKSKSYNIEQKNVYILLKLCYPFNPFKKACFMTYVKSVYTAYVYS